MNDASTPRGASSRASSVGSNEFAAWTGGATGLTMHTRMSKASLIGRLSPAVDDRRRNALL